MKRPCRHRHPVCCCSRYLGRYCPLRRCPVAQLAIEVPAPTVQAAIRLQCACMSAPCRHRQPVCCCSRYLGRHCPICRCPVAQLTIAVIAPTVQASIRLDRARMLAPCSHRQPVRCPARDLGRYRLRRRCPVPQSAKNVRSPTVEATIRLQCACMTDPCHHRLPVCCYSRYLGRDCPLRRYPVAQLAIKVIAPTVEAAIRLQCACMTDPCRHRHPVCCCSRYLGRHCPLRRCPVAQLAIGVVSPTPQRTVKGNATGMIRTCRQLQPTIVHGRLRI